MRVPQKLKHGYNKSLREKFVLVRNFWTYFLVGHKLFNPKRILMRVPQKLKHRYNKSLREKFELVRNVWTYFFVGHKLFNPRRILMRVPQKLKHGYNKSLREKFVLVRNVWTYFFVGHKLFNLFKLHMFQLQKKIFQNITKCFYHLFKRTSTQLFYLLQWSKTDRSFMIKKS